MSNCVSPPELSDAVLLSVLGDLADQEVRQHLESCEYCSRRLRNLERGIHNLTSRVYRSLCPDPMDLTAFHLGELTEEKVTQIREHLELCADCRKEITQFSEFMRATEHNERKSNTRSKAVDFLIANLQNVGGSLALAGVRGAGSNVPQVYTVGEMQISITIEEMAEMTDRFRLTGLLLGAEGEEWIAHLWNPEKLLGSHNVRDGEISFETLERGTYTLILDGPEDSPNCEIHLQNIQV